YGLSTPRRAGNERRARGRQTALGDDAEAGNARRDFLHAITAALGLRRHRHLSASGRSAGALSACAALVGAPVTRRRGAGARVAPVGVARTRSSSARSGSCCTSPTVSS